VVSGTGRTCASTRGITCSLRCGIGTDTGTSTGSPKTSDDKRLTVASIWGRADDDVWAAGSYSSWPDNLPALFHYDGCQWTELEHAPTTGKAYVLVTGDAYATWAVTDQPRFFRFTPPVAQ